VHYIIGYFILYSISVTKPLHYVGTECCCWWNIWANFMINDCHIIIFKCLCICVQIFMHNANHLPTKSFCLAMRKRARRLGEEGRGRGDNIIHSRPSLSVWLAANDHPCFQNIYRFSFFFMHALIKLSLGFLIGCLACL